ncbi:MAG: dienelactone hydrolase family protein [Nitrospinae bacterium]|nr:dienelactone hydrolase family protein [Nitrospinota bacterium]
MQEKHVDITTKDGAMDTFITHPDGSGPFSAVIIYMDAPGIREELYDYARRIGTVGYYCLVPDLYYRQGKVRFDLSKVDDAMREKYRAMRRTLTNDLIMDDTRALLHFMAQGEPVKPGAKGAVGYCMGGTFVTAAVSHFPEEFKAGASLHGVSLVTDADDSPHRLLHRFQGELYYGFGELDALTPPAEIAKLDAGLKRCACTYQIEVHPGADHGYSFPVWPTYQRAGADRNWERIFAMFHRQIPAYT